MHNLICTDGSPAAEQAARLVKLLNYPPETQITLLGVSEGDGDQTILTESIHRMTVELGGPCPEISQTIRSGEAADQILAEARETKYDLIVVGSGSHERHLRLWKVGSLTQKLAREAGAPLLIARNVPAQLKKLLVCTAGEAASFDTLRLSGQLLAHTEAEVGLLHVMSQVALRVDSPPADLHDSAESAIQRNTREGQHLQRGRNLLQQMGLRGPVVARLRHGLVVDQVMAEMHEGGYDMLVVGAHYQLNLNRWMQILLEDVTGQLLAHSPSSVLVV